MCVKKHIFYEVNSLEAIMFLFKIMSDKFNNNPTNNQSFHYF